MRLKFRLNVTEVEAHREEVEARETADEERSAGMCDVRSGVPRRQNPLPLPLLVARLLWLARRVAR